MGFLDTKLRQAVRSTGDACPADRTRPCPDPPLPGVLVDKRLGTTRVPVFCPLIAIYL